MSSVLKDKLSNCDLTEQLKTNKDKYLSSKVSKNLVAIYDQNLFVWNDHKSCLLSIDLNASENQVCKVLSLSNPPVFDVESLLFNKTGNLIALSGKGGVMIFEVPWKLGKFGEEDGSIVGRSWNIAEYFFIRAVRVNVVQVAWHPGSLTNTHLTILSTDNYLRTYDVSEPQTPQQVISLQSGTKNSYLSSESKMSFSTFFGESAVSFDFGSPEEISMPIKDNMNKVVSQENVTAWPIYLLHLNGDIYVAKTIPRDKWSWYPSKVIGPLAMHPPSEDNYGYDACNILCLRTVPNCLVIASASGVIYHCIVLENPDSQNNHKPDQTWVSGSSRDQCDVSLYVFESIELPLSITDEQDDSYSHPLRLYKDVTSNSKYHCTHIAGMHSVAVLFLHGIEKFLEADDIEKFFTAETKQNSVVEHTLCTRPLSQMESVPVIGLDVFVNNSGVTIISLLASWEFITLPLITSYFSSMLQLLSENSAQKSSSSQSPSSAFEQQLEKLLQRNVSCPLLKVQDYDNATDQQKLELLCTITHRCRDDYIQPLNTAYALLRSRIKVLSQQKEYQLRDIAKCKESTSNLREGTEKLAERYEEAFANHQILLKRIESTLQKVQQISPQLSKAEVNMKESLTDYSEKLKQYENDLELIRKKLKQNQEKKTESGKLSLSKSARSLLSDNQAKHIKEILKEEGESISDLIKSVTLLNTKV